MPYGGLEALQAQSWARHRVDVNRGMRISTGIDLDLNGISKFLFGSDVGANFANLLRMFEGALLLSGGANSYAETTDKVALDIAGDIDFRVEFMSTFSLLQSALWSKWSPTTQQSYQLILVPALGLAQLSTSSTGANALTSQLSTAGMSRLGAFRATLDVDNGAAGRTARFYTASTLAGPWVEMAGSPIITAGVTTIFNSTAVLRLGAHADNSQPFIGRISRAELRNGIDGTVVANPDFRNLAKGTTSFADAAGNTWTIGAGAQVI
jgi:hypothetical protein